MTMEPNKIKPPWHNPLVILIGINIVVYIFEIVLPDSALSFALSPSRFLSAPWTAVTSIFIHANIFHILLNMLALHFLGGNLIQAVGKRMMLSVYVVGGIVGSLFFVLLGPSNSFALGASGAVFAVAGALVVLRPTLRVIVFPIPFRVPLWVGILGSGLIISFIPNVAWQAHLGGLLTGIATALFVKHSWLRR